MAVVKEKTKALLRRMTKSVLVQTVLRAVARTDLLPRAVWGHVPCSGAYRVSLPDGKSFACPPVDEDDAIGRMLYWRGWLAYEPETTEIFYTLARQANFVVDVGANTGFFSLLACAANEHSRVIAFEAVPTIYEHLAKQIALNGWETRCQARCEAVAEFRGSAQFHVPLGSGIPTSASLDTSGFRSIKGNLINVPVVTLDSVCDGPVDLVKIDVENQEHRVLQGMSRILAESHPAIVLECNPDGPCVAVEAILRPFGYRFYHLGRNGPVLKEAICPDPTQELRNYLCLAQDSPL